MKRIFLFPTELEAEPYRKLCPNAEIVISGVGMAATAATIARLCAEYKLGDGSIVVLAGLAGAYDTTHIKGEVVEVVEECCSELPVRFQQRYCVEAYTSLRQVISNSVHGKGIDASNAQIENMEGATLFAMAEMLDFRAVEIRAISNYVGETFETWNVSESLVNLANVLKNL